MPLEILNSVIYLYRDKDDADTGVAIGASGCLIGVPAEADNQRHHIYAVTNAHVIEEGCPVVRVNWVHPESRIRQTFCFDFKDTDWVKHPAHDIAVCPLPPDAPGLGCEIAPIRLDRLITRQHIIDEQIGPGDDLFYVGRFMGHAGQFENLPSVRFGTVSMLPNEREPIYDDNLKHRREQVGYLVEARSRSGYSGSPVFMYWQHAMSSWPLAYGPSDIQTPIPVSMSLNIFLLGIDWGHLPETIRLRDPVTKHLLPQVAEVHAGMMGVVPSWHIRGLIEESPRLKTQRLRDDEYHRNRYSGTTGVCDAP